MLSNSRRPNLWESDHTRPRHIFTRYCCATQKIRFHTENVACMHHIFPNRYIHPSSDLFSWWFVTDHGDNRTTKLCLDTFPTPIFTTWHVDNVKKINKLYPPRGLVAGPTGTRDKITRHVTDIGTIHKRQSIIIQSPSNNYMDLTILIQSIHSISLQFSVDWSTPTL